MGKENINNGHNGKTGTHGAYLNKPKRERLKLATICKGVINYLRMAGETICGFTYGSESVYTDEQAKTELYKMVVARHCSAYGQPPDFTPDEVGRIYRDVRKGNYKICRDGGLIQSEYYPLFGDDEDLSKPISTIYTYWGSNQKAHRRLIKIGYTDKPLGEYLRRLERQYDPQLLASQCGGEADEKRELARWRRFLAEGREWFFPVQTMFDTFRREWKITADFDRIMREALKEP